MDSKTKSKTDTPEQFRDMAEKGATQSKEALEKMSAATGQAADVMKNCYSTAIKGAQITTTSSSNLLTPTPMPPSTLPRGWLA